MTTPPDDPTAPVTADDLRDRYAKRRSEINTAGLALAHRRQGEYKQRAEQAEAERSALRAAIARGKVAQFAAHVLALVDDYSDPEQSVVARLPFLATFDQLCFEKYGFSTDSDALAALDTPDTAPQTRDCPRCEGSRFEPGTEQEGDWDSAAMRHHPYTGEPCTACNGTGKAPQTPEASDG